MPTVQRSPDFPGAEEIRAHLEAETKRVTVEWGQPPLRGVETAWVWSRGQWRISRAWLLVILPRQASRGFRLSVGGGWELEVWHEKATMRYESPGPIQPYEITRLINAMFGFSGTEPAPTA